MTKSISVDWVSRIRAKEVCVGEEGCSDAAESRSGMYVFVHILHFFGAHLYVYISSFLYIMVSHPKTNLSLS